MSTSICVPTFKTHSCGQPFMHWYVHCQHERSFRLAQKWDQSVAICSLGNTRATIRLELVPIETVWISTTIRNNHWLCIWSIHLKSNSCIKMWCLVVIWPNPNILSLIMLIAMVCKRWKIYLQEYNDFYWSFKSSCFVIDAERYSMWHLFR